MVVVVVARRGDGTIAAPVVVKCRGGGSGRCCDRGGCSAGSCWSRSDSPGGFDWGGGGWLWVVVVAVREGAKDDMEGGSAEGGASSETVETGPAFSWWVCLVTMESERGGSG